MRLDWECVRTVMSAVEALDGRDMLAPATLPGVSEEQVVEHFRLLREAGLMEGYPAGERPLFAVRLTWAGHQLLATMRSRTLWERIKTEARDKGLELSMAVIKTLAARVLAAF